ncbi:PD-(D/E)XK nuclease family protein [Patescibacteria group bacterium]|nr:PD-(D/E)XK nuclease family protein [Patescibacteria group bacterium]
MRTSYSSLQTYKQCPQKYKFQEIDRVPAKKSIEAIFGTHIHGVLKRMFEKDPLFPTLDELLDYYRANWPAKEKIGWDETTENIYREEGVKMIKNFYAKNAPWNFNVVDLESRFEVLIPDEKHGTTHVLAGKIDRIDKIGENEFEVIDYKTAKRLSSQDSVNHDLQLSLYGLGLKKRWPHLKTENIKLSLYFLKHQEKLSTIKTEKEIEATTEDALGTIEEIEKKLAANERFEPIPSALCDWCSYKPICPAWKHLYRNRQQTTGNIEPILKEYFALKKEEQKNEQRLKELQKEIGTYMDAQGFDRLFNEEGVVSRKLQKRVSYDFEKIRHILEPIGKWQDILDADDKKLKNMMSGLPQDIQERIQFEGIIPKEFFVMTTTLKKQKMEGNL